MDIDRTFATLANRTSQAAGSPWTFCACVALVVGWALSGPAFKFSETWQLVINTGTTIVTFLMVFLIQNTQNRDNAAMQAKLDDIILMSGADNEFIGIEQLTDKELAAFRERCARRAKAHADLHAKVSQHAEQRAAKRKAAAPSRKPAGRKAA
jgi:low affinity Fe/Cu permease